MKENDSNEILVVDSLLERHLLGVIYQHDLISHSPDVDLDLETLNAEQFMKPVEVLAREFITLEECQRILDENHLEHLPIVDDENHLCGVYDRINHLKPIKVKKEAVKVKVSEDVEDLDAERMEDEGGHDSHTVH